MPPQTLRIPAYAKINLTLEVLGRRTDGYHDVATVMQTVSLADTVTLQSSADFSVHCDEPDLSGDRNIVWDAAVALADYAGIEPTGRITVIKSIPTAAGLGGGSADAAAALRGLNRLWGLGLSFAELVEVAAGLGSDVPFLVHGGTACGTGRGDQLERLPPLDHIPMLLVAPAESIPAKTPTLYGALTPTDFSNGATAQNLADSLRTPGVRFTSDACVNTFTRAALEIFPGLAGVWEATASVTRHAPCLSGAGPAFYCAPSDELERAEVQRAVQDFGATVHLVHTLMPAQTV